MKKDQLSSDQPAAYDSEGRPLYLHPKEQATEEPPKAQTVHITRPTNPEKPVVSDEIKLKNERSKQVYPELSLSDHEYVITSVKRHSIGLFIPILLGGILNVGALIAILFYDIILEPFKSNGGTSISASGFIFSMAMFIILVSLITYVVYYVFTNNRFLLTNESVIQEIRTTLFSKRTQTVSLANVEETSYSQNGIIQNIFNYGSIRLSTIGDENTYRFTFVDDPKKYVDILNNAVEAFKNGRPVENG